MHLSVEAVTQTIDESVVIGEKPQYMPVDPSAYLNLIPSSSFFRPPQPYNGQTPQWVIDQCKTNANIDFRNCENKALDVHGKKLDRCNWVANTLPKVAFDGTVGTSDKSWIKYLGGKLTVSGGVTFVDPATYGTICVKKAEAKLKKDTNICANTRDEKCQRKV